MFLSHGNARMVPQLLLVAVLSLLVLAVSAVSASAEAVPGQYIVTLKPGQDGKRSAEKVKVKPKKVYTHALNGFAAKLSDDQLKALKTDPSVESIEQDQVVSATTTQNMDAAGDPWGLDRIDQRPLPLSKTFSYNKDGTTVRAYILDTGLQANHPEFGGRAANMFNATSGGAADCNGHGTHVAGTVGARTYGVAKNVYLRGVKVLSADCSKNGTWSDVIQGLDWVRANAIKPAVVNMSLGGPKTTAVNTAVRNVVNSGIFVAVSAGNDAVDACTASPASEPAVFTTAASAKTDARAAFSNRGACVDGYAPGVAVKSTYINSSTASLNGTSMASPHVAGVGALLCAYGPNSCTPSFVNQWITQWSTANVITGNPAGTPNRLLWKGTL